MKLRLPPQDLRWRPALKMASGAMSLTVAMIAAAGVWMLGMPLGAAILLGAILAPTDPVLASDVQVEHPFDSVLMFTLTGEAGCNDCMAFPFVMLGLVCWDSIDIGQVGLAMVGCRCALVTDAGVAIGALLGTAVGRLVVYLRREHREALGLDEFLTLGLIGVSYGIALLCHAYGFLAVFAAGLAMRRVEAIDSDQRAAERADGSGPSAAC